MNRHTLIEDLLGAPARIREAEEALLGAARNQQHAKDLLQDVEADLLTAKHEDGTPVIDGKNAEIRAAQVREHTITLQSDLRLAENETARARIALAFKQNTFSALRAVAGLLGPEVTP